MNSDHYQSIINPRYSAFHRRQRSELLHYLINQFGYSKELAMVFLEIHECSDLPQMMSLFILNDNDKASHVFIPNGQDEQTAVCQACGQSLSTHEQSITWTNWCYWLERIQDIENKQSIWIQDEPVQTLKESLDRSQATMKRLEDLIEELGANERLISNSDNTQKIECQICYSYHNKSEIVQIQGVSHEICLNCMGEYLKEEIINLRVQDLKCPHCGMNLSDQIIKGYVNNSVYEKYQIFLRNIEIQKNPNMKWCPNPKCSVVISTKKSRTLTCPKCSTKICGKCNRVYHPKQSCNSMQRKQLEGLQNAKDIQKCKKCMALVEKISGCNHMTCSVCSYEWCWLCGSTYSSVHFSPINPFGCAGMQNTNFTSFGRCKVLVLRILTFLGFLVLFPIVAVLAIIGVGPVLLVTWTNSKFYNSSCCFKFFRAIPLLIIGLVLDPIFWIGVVIFFAPKIFEKIRQYFQNRRRIHQSSQNFLKRRLIEGDNNIIMEPE